PEGRPVQGESHFFPGAGTKYCHRKIHPETWIHLWPARIKIPQAVNSAGQLLPETAPELLLPGLSSFSPYMLHLAENRPARSWQPDLPPPDEYTVIQYVHIDSL